MSRRQRRLKKLGSIRRYHERAIIVSICNEQVCRNNLKTYAANNAIWCSMCAKPKRRTRIRSKYMYRGKNTINISSILKQKVSITVISIVALIVFK